MTKAERDIMRHFRKYRVGVNEMLCFDTNPSKTNSSEFQVAMTSLIESGSSFANQRRSQSGSFGIDRMESTG